MKLEEMKGDYARKGRVQFIKFFYWRAKQRFRMKSPYCPALITIAHVCAYGGDRAIPFGEDANNYAFV